MKIAVVKYIGDQRFTINGEELCLPLYNIVSGDGLPIGSTVTRTSLERQGYTVVEDKAESGKAENGNQIFTHGHCVQNLEALCAKRAGESPASLAAPEGTDNSRSRESVLKRTVEITPAQPYFHRGDAETRRAA